MPELSLRAAAARISPDLMTRAWPAAWCRLPGALRRAPGVYLFRKRLDLATLPSSYMFHITADARYQFFVNGERIAWGPARGDLAHWRFETLDIAPRLRAGENILAVRVSYLGEMAPMAQMGSEAGLLVQGDGATEAAVNTPGGWKVRQDDAYTFSLDEARALRTYCVVGPSETLDAARHPWGWERAGFDDSAWADAERIAPGTPRAIRDAGSPWFLVPNPLPPMEETPQTFSRAARADGVEIPAGWPQSAAVPLTVPPHTRATLLLDQGHETTAFPEITVTGGAGATLRLAYAEALVDADGKKGHRDDTAGRTLRGYSDTWRLDGGASRVLQPLWWRTFRYVELSVETGEEALTVDHLHSLYTGYPFAERARFDAPEIADAKDLWDIGWRTARLCAHESYMDCPYYEQLQYAGDTRIQCLVSLYASGDPRLFQNALAHLDDSRIPDGITQSRYPSALTQIIPPFSLWWIGMVHDYWRHVPDPDFVRGLLPGVRGVLDWFRRRQRADGLLGPLAWWNFVDWATEWPGGVPPGATGEGGSSVLALQYALALKDASDLEAALGRPDEARRLGRESDAVARAVRAACFDDLRNRVADTPERASFSQHAGILAVLADSALTGNRRRKVMERVLSDPEMTQVTFYFRFYLHRALVRVGMGDRFLDQLGPWRDMKAIGLTTWAEKPEPTRSDCHAWSASPNYEFLATVLGVTPDAPGFARVRIAPHLGTLTTVSGTVPHPAGEITVALHRDGDNLEAGIALPNGIPGTLAWKGRTVALHGGSQQVTL